MRKNKIIFILIVVFLIFIGSKNITYYRIFSDSMYPTYKKGDYVLTINKKEYKKGDIVFIKKHNKIILRRIIAIAGEEIDINSDGNVFINSKFQLEPFIKNKSKEPINIKLPKKIEKGTYFVMGDNRNKSLDSRINSIGLISKDDIIGKLLFKMIP